MLLKYGAKSNIRIHSKKVDLEKVNDILETETAFYKDKVVFIYGDEDIEYQYIRMINKILKEHKLKNCLFMTKREKKD